jgi:hypothetical protein
LFAERTVEGRREGRKERVSEEEREEENDRRIKIGRETEKQEGRQNEKVEGEGKKKKEKERRLNCSACSGITWHREGKDKAKVFPVLFN